MTDEQQTTGREARLERVRQVAWDLSKKKRYGIYCTFGPPCFVDCPCWHEAEGIVDDIAWKSDQ